MRLLPGCLRVESYSDWVGVYLNLPYAKVANTLDVRDAVLLATDEQVSVPDDWVDLMTDDEGERLRWKAREFRRGL